MAGFEEIWSDVNGGFSVDESNNSFHFSFYSNNEYDGYSVHRVIDKEYAISLASALLEHASEDTVNIDKQEVLKWFGKIMPKLNEDERMLLEKIEYRYLR